jgi:hypothetical protein
VSPDVVQFFGVMMTLVVTGLAGDGGLTRENLLQRRSKPARSAIEPAELDEIRAQLADVEELRERVSELEGRLDFAERLLARQPEALRLEGGIRRDE